MMQAIRSAIRGTRHRDAASGSVASTSPSGLRTTRRRLGATLLLCAAIAATVTSCAGDPSAASPGDGSPVTSAAEGAGATAATVATPPDPEPTAPDAEPATPDAGAEAESDATPAVDDPEPTAPGPRQEIEGDGATTWQEVFDTFTASEQSCIREALGDEVLGSLLEERVTESELADGEWSLFPCLEPEVAESLMLSTLIWTIEDEEQLELGDEARACLREWVGRVDWNELATADDDPAPISALVTGALNCVPDVLLGGMLGDMGLDLDELSDDERACLRDWITGIDWTRLTTDDEAAALALAEGIIGCVPDLMLATMLDDMGTDLEELSDDERACLHDWIADIDWTRLTTDDEAAALAPISGMMVCVPDLMLANMLGETPKLSDEERACLHDWIADIDWVGLTTEGGDFPAFEELHAGFIGCINDPFGAEPPPATPDDHADIAVGATPATVGEPIDGVVDYDGDLDFFAFEAAQGRTYEIDVTLGTLGDSTAMLYTADREYVLGYNDDTDDSLASHITWLAPGSGEYLIAVGGYGTGSYTLTIGTAQATDDAST